MRYKVGMAAAASVITTIGLVGVPQQEVGGASARVEVAAVHLDAVLAAEVSAIVLSVPENDSAATIPVPDARTIQEVVDAAVSGIAGVLTVIGRTVLDAVGFVIAPLWWLAVPVTYGIDLETRRRQSSGPYIATIIDAAGWLVAPFNLGTVIFGRAGSNPAASTPEPARSAQTVDAGPSPNPRAKISAPHSKATVPLSAAASEHSDETATVPDTETPSAGRGKANTPKAEAQRPNRPEMTKAEPRN